MASAGSPCENTFLFFRYSAIVLPSPILVRKIWGSKGSCAFAIIGGLCPRQESNRNVLYSGFPFLATGRRQGVQTPLSLYLLLDCPASFHPSRPVVRL